MRLSIWQFLALIATLVAVYFGYHYWWVMQDHKGWAEGFGSWVFNSEEETASKPAGEEPKAGSDGWIR